MMASAGMIEDRKVPLFMIRLSMTKKFAAIGLEIGRCGELARWGC